MNRINFPDEKSAVQSLKNSYNFIIKIDLEKDTAECVHKYVERPVGISYDVVLSLESASDYFLNRYVTQEDYEVVEEFFGKILDLRDKESVEDFDDCIEAVYTFRFDDGDVRKYAAAVLVLNVKTVFLCGRDITDAKPSQKLISRSRVYGKMQAHISSVLSFYHVWSITFEITDRRIFLIYVCPEVCRWMSLSNKEFWQIGEFGISIDEFLVRIGLSEYDFNRILRNYDDRFTLKTPDGASTEYRARLLTSNSDGKTVFTIFFSTEDFNSIFERMMRDNTTPESDDSEYVESGAFIPGKDSKIWVRTFGSFDVFIEGVPLRFSSAKSKELLALLVDRRGGSLSAEEAISYLWEDRAADKQVMSNYRKVAMRLQNTLEQYGIGDLVINNRGVRSLNMAIVDCDYYRFLVNDRESIALFHGQYMQNYSWAENTLGMLLKRVEQS